MRNELRDGDLILRRPKPSDIDERLACGRNAEAVRMYGGGQADVTPLTREEVQAWYNRPRRSRLAWMIDFVGQCIGQARLHGLDRANHRAHYAIGIFNSAHWGHGLGERATRLGLRFAFEELQLHRVDLRVLAYNERARACYKKCGFVEEGIERDSALIDGEWYDDIMMSIIETEYRQGAWANNDPDVRRT